MDSPIVTATSATSRSDSCAASVPLVSARGINDEAIRPPSYTEFVQGSCSPKED
jgi:hypothetical protein